MKILKLALCAAAASAALSGAAMAQDTAPAFSFNVGATSDYLFRGLTQTAKDPAVFGGADVTAGLVYGGVWGSTVDFADAEIDVYAGVKPVVGPITFDLGVIYYGYVGSDVSNAAYWEGKVAASIAAGEGSLGLAYYYSPEFFGDTGKADYWELNGSQPLPFAGASLSGAIGRQSLSRGSYGVDGYTTGNIGVTVPISKISLDLRYVYTDDDAKIACVGCSSNKFVGTIKAVF